MKRNLESPKVLYIAGYGRSGSTLLEGILNGHPAIFALGELSTLTLFWPENPVLCSCGKELNACAFWRPILKKLLAEIGPGISQLRQIQLRAQGIGHWSAPFAGNAELNQHIPHYVRYLQMLFELIRQEVPSETEVLSDASKTTYASCFRPRLLYQLYGEKLHIIHLVRDPRAVLYSTVTRGLRRPMHKKERGLRMRAIIGWLVANSMADSISKLVSPQCYQRIKYEDIMTSPAKILAQIGDFLSLDVSMLSAQLLRQGISNSSSHQVFGNPVTQAATRLTIKPDVEWVNQISFIDRWMCELSTFTKLRKYSYHFR